MSKNSFRVSTGAKKIEVNDDGDYITLNLSDQSFLPRLASIIDTFNAKFPEYEARAKEIDEMAAETKEQRFYNMKLAAEYNESVHRELIREVDAVFGDDVCRKVFGPIVPSTEMFVEFFEKLTPYIEKFSRERVEKMSNYNPNRTGNT